MDNKIDKTITKLNRLTKEGSIKWSTHKGRASSLSSSESQVGHSYLARASSIMFRLYKYEYRVYTDLDEFTMLEAHRLEVIDEEYKSMLEFPRDTSVRDLYDTVRYKTSEIFLDKFLSE